MNPPSTTLQRAAGRASTPGLATLALLLTLAAAPAAERRVAAPGDLAEFTLEQLLDLKVISVSKRPESWFGSAAAIDVVTGEDIHRSGALTIADALRGVPGLAVARMDSHTWAVSPRGFNSELASKTLVLMDGRSVYTPLNAGVYWDAQDTVLEDIDRVEIVRGPGGALWGANAVNGVINIITRSARDTQGLHAEAGGGSLERVFGTVRYGGALGERAWFRVYGKYFERDDFLLPGGAEAGDSWYKGQGGFRIDWEADAGHHFTFQGDLYEGREHQTRTSAIAEPPYALTTNTLDRFAGHNLLGRWTHTFDESELQVQAYYDRTVRENAIPEEERSTFDLDAQHRFKLGERQEIIWGLGYRVTADEMQTNFALAFTQPTRTSHLFSAFVQDELTLVPEQLRFTLGSKFEHNDFTGLEFQPSGRLAWTPSAQHTLWAAVSRAVRTPSRAEDDLRSLRPLAPGLPLYIGLNGNRSAGSEELLAYEVGWRVQPHRRVALDLTAFYNDYDHLRTVEPGPTMPPALTTFYSADLLTGEAYGAEAAVSFEAADWWRLRGSYSFLRFYLHPGGSGAFPVEQLFEDNEAVHRVSLRSQMDLPGNLHFDVAMHYVDELRTPGVGSYVALDVRLAWRPCPNTELAVVGTDLLDNQHAEFSPISNPAPLAEVPRAVYGKLTIKF